MRILVCGDRHWTDKEAIKREMTALGSGHILIQGCAKGADILSVIVARELGGWAIQHFWAEWDKYGRAAGPIRNQQMLESSPDLVLAFHANLAASKGTKDMVNRARKAGIPTKVITS